MFAAMSRAQLKLERLRDILRSYDGLLVAFSGGVDSTFLLKVGVDELGSRCHAVTCVSETMARSESDDARRLAPISAGRSPPPGRDRRARAAGFADNPRHRCAC